jgi:hypothetical protein
VLLHSFDPLTEILSMKTPRFTRFRERGRPLPALTTLLSSAVIVILAIALLLGTPGATHADPVLTVSNGEFLNNNGPGVPGQNGNDAFNSVNPVG